jgi:EAL domain-containing protein (putative c-di-GMP-specific phosphodiesterase class I)
VIGRSDAADHTIYSNTVSKAHAALEVVDGRHVVRDLDSTNGTFVNGQRASEQPLEDGDIVQVAQVEFCFRLPAVRPAASLEAPAVERTLTMASSQAQGLIRGTALLRQLIDEGRGEIVFQPIVDLKTGDVLGYEALARGTHPELSREPEALFRLAMRCGLAVEVTQFFRRLAAESSGRLPAGAKLFINAHPLELAEGRLLESVAALAPLAVGHPMVIEIPESSVTDVRAMTECKAALAKLGVGLAYDDFGAGQARFVELTDSPPDYLKLDRGIIQDIDTALPRLEMVKALLAVVRTLGVKTVAEGIETRSVATICKTLGFDFGQGFLLGRPS